MIKTSDAMTLVADINFYATNIDNTISLLTILVVLINCMVASQLICPPLNCLDLAKLFISKPYYLKCSLKNSYMAYILTSINDAGDTLFWSTNTVGTKETNLSLKISVIVPPRNIPCACNKC